MAETGLKLTKNACNLGLPDSLLVLPDDFFSVDNPPKPIAMTALFGPLMPGPLGNLIPTTLTAAAQSCGYTGFNWQQVVTVYPHANLIPGAPSDLTAPFLDPPGSTYYFTADEILNKSFCNVPITSPDDMALWFCDSPQNGGGTMAFETNLVGLKLLGGQDILRQWFWTSTYNTGKSGGVVLAPQGSPKTGQ